MASYREIVTKAVIGKGKKNFTTTHTLIPQTSPSTILGCWVINHKFNGSRDNHEVTVNGSYDVNVWYSCLNDTKTEVVTETINYTEIISINRTEDQSDATEEIIVRSTKQPACIKAEIDGEAINFVVEKELSAELIGDVKIKIEVNDRPEESSSDEEVMTEIDNEVEEDFIN